VFRREVEVHLRGEGKSSLFAALLSESTETINTKPFRDWGIVKWTVTVMHRNAQALSVKGGWCNSSWST
jgi:hypothetical protein